MMTDHERIGIALDVFSEGIFPFFERELRAEFGEDWNETVRAGLRSQSSSSSSQFRWDAQAILTVMWDRWNTVFRKSLGIIERSIVSELREFRNRWAHQARCTEDDSYRVLDNVQRLLTACGAAEHAARIEDHKIDLLRVKLGRRVNEEIARARFNRSRLVDSGLFALCAIAITALMILVWGHKHPKESAFVIGFTLFVFSYLIYKRFQSRPPAYGVHECEKCGKVIYTEDCPYCDSSSIPIPRETSDNSERNAMVTSIQSVASQTANGTVTRRKKIARVES